MIQLSKKVIDGILKKLVILSIGVILCLRIYAIFYTVHVVTWDDKQYRQEAIKAAENRTVIKALRWPLFPNEKTVVGRSVGYHSWLLLGLKVGNLLGIKDSENIFQIVNSMFLIAQMVILFLFSMWATSDYLFSLTLVFLYVSSPIVFGMNRWVLTENLVMTGLLVFSFLTSWLMTRDWKNNDLVIYKWEIKNKANIIFTVLGAYVYGIFTTIREYAIPSILGISSAFVIGLWWEKRRKEALTFLLVLSPFIFAAIIAWNKLLSRASKVAFNRNEPEVYVNPVIDWFLHNFLHGSGLALTIFVILYFIIAITYIIKLGLSKNCRWGDFIKPEIIISKISGLSIIWLLHLFLLILYLAIIIVISGKRTRMVIMPLESGLSLLLITTYIFQSIKKFLATTYARITYIILIILAWIVLYYQLFIAFDGGKSYALHPYNLEFYNHPLHLRQLRDKQDRHICGEKGIVCPYQIYK